MKRAKKAKKQRAVVSKIKNNKIIKELLQKFTIKVIDIALDSLLKKQKAWEDKLQNINKEGTQ